MIVDLHRVQKGNVLDFDICIVGAGAAGIAMARDLIGSGLSVCLLESGGFKFESETQALSEGISTCVKYMPLSSAQLRFFGGTTNHWEGQSVPLDPFDFTVRAWVPCSGWSLPYSELVAYLPRAQEVCGLGTPPFDWNYWAKQPGMPSYPLDPQQFRPVVLRYSTPITRFGKAYRVEIEQAANVTCFLHANVLAFEAGDNNRTVRCVLVKTLDGHEVTVQPRVAVLATGAIENCRLLLVSGAGGRGFGNQHDLVGRYFMEHPNYDLGGEVVIDTSQKTAYLTDSSISSGAWKRRLDFQLPPDRQAQLRILNHSIFLISASKRRAAHGASQLVRAWNKVEDMLGLSAFQIRIRLEHAPYPDSRVTLADKLNIFGQPHAQVNYQFGDLETTTIATVLEEVAREFGRAGLARVRITFDPTNTPWQSEVGWQFHHTGGTRMHADPAMGVVDTDCRVHGMSNLYIAGGSIFPTSGHANPTLNLVALALRLADHLKKELRQ